MTKDELTSLLENNVTLIELGFNAAKSIFIGSELRKQENLLNEQFKFENFKKAIFDDVIKNTELEKEPAEATEKEEVNEENTEPCTTE